MQIRSKSDFMSDRPTHKSARIPVQSAHHAYDVAPNVGLRPQRQIAHHTDRIVINRAVDRIGSHDRDRIAQAMAVNRQLPHDRNGVLHRLRGGDFVVANDRDLIVAAGGPMMRFQGRRRSSRVILIVLRPETGRGREAEEQRGAQR